MKTKEFIENLSQHFNDEDFTYTRHLELMIDSMLEILRLQNMAIELSDKNVPSSDLTTNCTTDFFFKISMLLFNCKPLAAELERRLQENDKDNIGYKLKNETK